MSSFSSSFSPFISFSFSSIASFFLSSISSSSCLAALLQPASWYFSSRQEKEERKISSLSIYFCPRHQSESTSAHEFAEHGSLKSEFEVWKGAAIRLHTFYISKREWHEEPGVQENTFIFPLLLFSSFLSDWWANFVNKTWHNVEPLFWNVSHVKQCRSRHTSLRISTQYYTTDTLDTFSPLYSAFNPIPALGVSEHSAMGSCSHSAWESRSMARCLDCPVERLSRPVDYSKPSSNNRQ